MSMWQEMLIVELIDLALEKERRKKLKLRTVATIVTVVCVLIALYPLTVIH